MEYAYELNCLIKDKGNFHPFSLKISKPFQSSENEDEYHCLVYVPYLYKQPKTIAGYDKEQSIELAKKFVGILIEEKGLFDEKGEKIEI